MMSQIFVYHRNIEHHPAILDESSHDRETVRKTATRKAVFGKNPQKTGRAHVFDVISPNHHSEPG